MAGASGDDLGSQVDCGGNWCVGTDSGAVHGGVPTPIRWIAQLVRLA